MNKVSAVLFGINLGLCIANAYSTRKKKSCVAWVCAALGWLCALTSEITE